LPTRLKDPCYDANHEVRRVRWNSMIKWRGEEALAGELIGLAEHESGSHHIARFCHRDLGVIDRDPAYSERLPTGCSAMWGSRQRMRAAQEELGTRIDRRGSESAAPLPAPPFSTG
jgi:hypothetical protein